MSTEPQASTDDQSHPKTRHFFVDEAGDPVILGKGGRVLVGNEGCSKFFLLGMAEIEDHSEAFRKIDELRTALLADPYFKGVPSMQPEEKKNAVCFHAKNDLPEVRRDVFKLLSQLRVRVRVAVWPKAPMASALKYLTARGWRGKFGNEMYDRLVQQLFHDQLHQAESNSITFARRGKSARVKALARAITDAKEVFRKHNAGSDDRPCEVIAAYPSDCVGLQIIDYHLWAYQRWIERGEDRFFKLVQDQFEPILGDPHEAEGKTIDPALLELRSISIKVDPPKEAP